MVGTASLVLFSALLASAYPMIMRNNALMTKMVSQFQGKEGRPPHKQINNVDQLPPQEEDTGTQEGSPSHVLSLMQNVLCKNFPTVPCELITKDETLRNLIEKSIQQLKYKKMTMDRTTPAPNYQLALFPMINSEDLSNFLQVSNTGMFKQNEGRKQKRNGQEMSHWSPEKKNKSGTAVINGRKKIRKFYPHKYKDKGGNTFLDSDERLSMSVEATSERSPHTSRKHFSYRGDPADPPVWRIDYMKHGEPSINMFGYESDLKGKIIKAGPNVIVDDAILEQAARRDVLHPDVYIKKNYNRKSRTIEKDDSEAVEHRRQLSRYLPT